jgi:beta-glucosidase
MLVTLHHFTLPRWLAKRGGWSDPTTAFTFARYAQRAAVELGPVASRFATMNEPSVLAWSAYAGTRWPPGLGSLPGAFIAIAHMLEAHARAYRSIRRARRDAEVGLVVNMPWFVPADRSRRRDRAAAAAQDWAFNGAVLAALTDGRLRFPLSVTARRVDHLAHSVDWLGLNYYGRYDVRFDPTATDAAFGRHVQEPTVRNEHTDWGQPSPEGMVHQLRRLSELGVPLYVTENGVFDNDDTERARFIEDHLLAVLDARRAGLDVRGYFVWSLVDNFEWAEGWSTRFGLLALDRETQARTPRPSAKVYETLCRAYRRDPSE